MSQRQLAFRRVRNFWRCFHGDAPIAHHPAKARSWNDKAALVVLHGKLVGRLP